MTDSPNEPVANSQSPNHQITKFQWGMPMATEQQTISWKRDLDPALDDARAQGRYVVIDFSAAPT